MPFILSAWIGTFCYGISVIINKLTSKSASVNPWLFNFVWTFWITVVTTAISLVYGAGFPQHWPSILVLGGLSTLAGLLYILALYRMDVTVLAPLYSLKIPLTVFFSMLLFHEQLDTSQVGYITIMSIAGMFVSIDERMSVRSFFNRTVALALIAVAVSAIYTITIRIALDANGYWEVNLWANLLTVVFNCFTLPLFMRDIRTTSYAGYAGVSVSGIVVGIGALLVYWAMRENVGITTAITSVPTSMIIAIILSGIAPQLLEKHTATVYLIRLVSAGVMFLGALALSF